MLQVTVARRGPSSTADVFAAAALLRQAIALLETAKGAPAKAFVEAARAHCAHLDQLLLARIDSYSHMPGNPVGKPKSMYCVADDFGTRMVEGQQAVGEILRVSATSVSVYMGRGRGVGNVMRRNPETGNPMEVTFWRASPAEVEFYAANPPAEPEPARLGRRRKANKT